MSNQFSKGHVYSTILFYEFVVYYNKLITKLKIRIYVPSQV